MSTKKDKISKKNNGLGQNEADRLSETRKKKCKIYGKGN
jgi:hypothetical protein